MGISSSYFLSLNKCPSLSFASPSNMCNYHQNPCQMTKICYKIKLRILSNNSFSSMPWIVLFKISKLNTVEDKVEVVELGTKVFTMDCMEEVGGSN